MPRPNWFLALPIDGAFVQGLPAAPANFRLFHPADVHATLAFLGPCGEDAALRAFDALGDALSTGGFSAIDGTLGEVVPMGGSRRGYTALSALLDRGREEATRLIVAVRDPALRAAGARPDARAPKPHVTLARPRTHATDANRDAGLSWASALHLRAVTARLDRVALYTWNEPRVDRFFRIVKELRLGTPVTASS